MTAAAKPPLTAHNKDWSWKFWQVVPLYPYGQRRTIRQEVVKNSVWTFDQIQGIFYVVVPIRMTVVKLAAGGLLVYAPVAPTPECVRLVRELEAEHGAVKYIILPTVSGIEHKVFVGPFARNFPDAEVYISPHQWSFPLNLPVSWLGLPWGRTKVLPEDGRQVPFADQFDYAILGSVELGLGKFAEVAMFDRRSQTLLVTDTIVAIPERPPEVLQIDPYPMLFHARDSALEPIVDTEVNRIRGWQRTALFLFYFRPQVLETVPFWQAIADIAKAPERSPKAFWGLFPFKWRDDWYQSFEKLRGNGRIFVAPILQTLILNRDPQKVIAWADRVASWNFKMIVPCHFDNAIAATPKDFRQAFNFLEKSPAATTLPNLPEEDFTVLKQINSLLENSRLVFAAKEKI
ncbi:DUF4336 domain-containing protein [Pseudanabaena sp. FACHB-1277]|jgi:hypothetical protein|uniref:DUF4336 domain-containing protein n=1 Tax=Pseudanabaena cinerea FACHB-1277 TaxID=2949581 RepID=A0A926US38_9CYAN|nr:DUF4336 domain-containing protein [Pseudanabaena cinerea]MBD2150210.1 DUF4336 domain-containing protein [Pseudanabaena cinerea FACHB-1277]